MFKIICSFQKWNKNYDHYLFFSKYLIFDGDSSNGKKKNEKIFFVFQIIAFELGVAKSHNLQHDTWHQQSMCQETQIRFQVIVGETFSKSASLKRIKTHHKSAIMEIFQVFGTLSHVDCQSMFQNEAFHRVV